jgi:hypothetical protein
MCPSFWKLQANQAYQFTEELLDQSWATFSATVRYSLSDNSLTSKLGRDMVLMA